MVSVQEILKDLESSGITAAKMSRTDLDRHIRWGLSLFNDYLPKYVWDTLTLESGTQTYALAETVRNVVRVYYIPVVASDTFLQTTTADINRTFYYPSQAWIYDSNYLQVVQNLMGGYEVFRGATGLSINLYPVPDDDIVENTGGAIPLLYTASRAIEEVPNDYREILRLAILSHVHRTLGTTDSDVTLFQDSGLVLRRERGAKKPIELYRIFERDFKDRAKARQVMFPTLRSDRPGYGR